MLTKEEAKKTVQHLAERYPYVPEDILSPLGPDSRRIIEEKWQAVESASGHPITELAKKIYDSGSQFVFELLQNADDCSFEETKVSGGAPGISFKVYADRIVVEYNEDGFTADDVEALCAVDQSSRTLWHGYTGAKGIGIKTAFIVARKIYIQSGPFSFYLSHEKGGSGMGMIRPIWVETDDALDGPLTRMTLFLRKSEDASELDSLRSMISRQFEELIEPCMLFLRNIKKVSLEFFNEDDEKENSKIFQVSEVEPHEFCLSVSTKIEVETNVEKHLYHVTRHVVNGLAAGENRNRPEPAQIRRRCSDTEVILAFPLTTDPTPVREVQRLFNFTPIKESCYRFIISADFDVDADGKDLITTSKRNADLQDAIAFIFMKAVLQFCDSPSKRYIWPHYLPDLETDCGTFWSSLNEKIKKSVLDMPVLRPENELKFCHLECLQLPILDENGDSIFGHGIEDELVSPRYTSEVKAILRQYGMKSLSTTSFIDMLETDINSPRPRMHNLLTSQAWHSTVARVLDQLLEDVKRDNSHEYDLERLQRIPILPLRDGQWTCAANSTVFMPYTNGEPISPSFNLDFLESRATANPERRLLFQHLGVIEPPVQRVRESFECRYKAGDDAMLSQAVADLRYLYLTHHLSHDIPSDILVYDENLQLVNPIEEDIYQIDDQKCGPKTLLQPIAGVDSETATFLHPAYFTEPTMNSNKDVPTWDVWIHNHIGVRKFLRLVDRTGLKLSSHAQYVAEHRPRNFLTLLEVDWSSGDSNLKDNKKVRNEIQNLHAYGFCGYEAGNWLLHETWLPIPHLQEKVSHYMDGKGRFPFLIIEDEDRGNMEARWKFLHEFFGVRVTDDVDFYLRLLIELDSNDFEKFSDDFEEKVCHIYIKIFEKIKWKKNPQWIEKYLRRVFSRGCILVPDSSEERIMWARPQDCLWNAPEGMISKFPLKQLYDPVVSLEKITHPDMVLLPYFFRDSLKIPDATWEDIVEELETLKEFACQDHTLTKELYRYLRSLAPNSSAKIKFVQFTTTRMTWLADQITNREAFKEKSIIFAEKNGIPGWWKASECAWSGTANEQDKVILSDQYEESEKCFFIDILGISLTTIRVIYDRLLQTDQQTSIENLKEDIWKLNEFLFHCSTELDPRQLKHASIFPVRHTNGEVALEKLDCDFAIGDRKHLLERYTGLVKLLDFTLEEVRRLEPFLHWLKLQPRYLSMSLRPGKADTEAKVLVETRTRNIRERAYGLLRIASTFQSYLSHSDPRNFYEILREVKVYETRSISPELKICQDGKEFNVVGPADAGLVTLTEFGLVIIVPAERKAQDFSFSCQIPQKLGYLLTLRGPFLPAPREVIVEATHIINVLLSSEISDIERSLDYFGVLEAPFPQVQDEVEKEPTLTGESPRPAKGPRISSLPPSTGDEKSSDPDLTHPVVKETRNITQSVPKSLPRVKVRLPDPKEYPSLVNKVLEASRKAIFPTDGSFNRNGLQDSLPFTCNLLNMSSFHGFDSEPMFQSKTEYGRGKTIGAAGELYVFELLSKQNLRGWSTAWRGMNRQNARGGDDVCETPDKRLNPAMVYQDTEGDLTKLLISHNYLDQKRWGQARPQYYIDVKATTGPRTTPFYMSNICYSRMKTSYYSDELMELCVIMRVFSLGSEDCGISIHLDPEKLGFGNAMFGFDTWTVYPGNS